MSGQELNKGIRRLSMDERDTLAPLLGNVQHQRQFRKAVQSIGYRTVYQILGTAFPEQTVTIQDFRRSLAHKLAEEKGVETAKDIMHGSGERTVILPEQDTATDDEHSS